MTARSLLRALPSLAAAALVAAVVAPGSGAGAATASSTTKGPAIQHVIVVMQSGHSFDNYFGTRAGVDGISPKTCEPLAVGSASCVTPFHLNSDLARSGLSDSGHATQKAIDGGKMDGFVKAQPNVTIGQLAMGYLDGSDLPYYWNLADRFTLFDQFYAGSQGGALPNRLISVSGQTAGVTSNTPPATGITVNTVFDQLSSAHLSWKYYVQGYQPSATPTTGEQIRTPLLDMPSMTGTASNADHIVNTSQYFTDLAKGQLPAVSYVSSSVDSERSPQNPALGEAFVQSLINALMQSSAWKHTALLLTYDDSGGWYDNAVPPTVGGTQLGLRVPAILVSPYARPGYVDSSKLNTASIPAMIESVFHLPQLTAQEDTAGSILTAINLHQTPVSPEIGPAQGGAAVIIRPRVSTIYVLYLVTLILVGLLVFLAFRRQRRVIHAEPASGTASAPTSWSLASAPSGRPSASSEDAGKDAADDLSGVEPAVAPDPAADGADADAEEEADADDHSDAPLEPQPTGQAGPDRESHPDRPETDALPDIESAPVGPDPSKPPVVEARVLAVKTPTTEVSPSNGSRANGSSTNQANGNVGANGKAKSSSQSTAAAKAQRAAKSQGSKPAAKSSATLPKTATDLLK